MPARRDEMKFPVHQGPTRLRRFCVGLACALSLTCTAQATMAGKVATWRHTGPNFAKGTLDGVVIDADGHVQLGHQVEALADLDCRSVWDLAIDKSGAVLAATAIPGRLVSVSRDGEKSELWKHDEHQAFSVLATEAGEIFIGTGPEGYVYRIRQDGTAEVFAKLDSQYVWDLVEGADGAIFAATGPEGRVYRLQDGADAEVYYESTEPHVLALAMTGDGALIVGTDGAGLVIKIDADRTARVLYDTEEGEVRALWVDHENRVFAATAAGGDGESRGLSSRTSTSSSSESKSSSSRKSQQNTVYCLDPNGAVHRVGKAGGMIFCLAAFPQGRPGEVLAGTGTEAKLFALECDRGSGHELARLDAESVLAMVATSDGTLVLGTGSPGKLKTLEAAYRTTGTLISAPLDAELVAEFGAFVWRADNEAGTQVTVAARTGNTAEPDDTWSPWSVELSDPALARADCTAARFLQYRLTLTSGDGTRTPTVRSLAIRYQTANQSPTIAKLTVPHVDEGKGASPTDKLNISWSAKDPNQDTLSYALRFRKPEWRTWVTLREAMDKEKISWDITSVPEGVYVLELKASDHPDNPPASARHVRRESEPFIVDRNGPEMAARLVSTERSASVFEVDANDAFCPVVRASYCVDSGDWVNVFPVDGLFDATYEKFRFEVTSLKAGTHVLVVRAVDAAGHTASTDVLFEIAAPAPQAAVRVGGSSPQ